MGGGGRSSQKPFFARSSDQQFDQKSAVGDIFQEFFRRFQSGTPDALESLSDQRGRDQIAAETAQQGLDPADPLTQRRFATQDQAGSLQREASSRALAERILTPIGQQGSSKQTSVLK